MQNSATFIDSAKVMAKGQVTIPSNVRKILGVSAGDRISFIVDGNAVRIVNTAVFALQMLQNQFEGVADKLGLTSEEDVTKLVKEIRSESISDEK